MRCRERQGWKESQRTRNLIEDLDDPLKLTEAHYSVSQIENGGEKVDGQFASQNTGKSAFKIKS